MFSKRTELKTPNYAIKSVRGDCKSTRLMQAKTRRFEHAPGSLGGSLQHASCLPSVVRDASNSGQNSDLPTPFAAAGASLFGGFPMLPILAELAKFAQHARTTSVATDEGTF